MFKKWVVCVCVCVFVFLVEVGIFKRCKFHRMKKSPEELFMQERVIFSFSIYKSVTGCYLPYLELWRVGKKQRIMSNKSGYVNQW